MNLPPPLTPPVGLVVGEVGIVYQTLVKTLLNNGFFLYLCYGEKNNHTEDFASFIKQQSQVETIPTSKLEKFSTNVQYIIQIVVPNSLQQRNKTNETVSRTKQLLKLAKKNHSKFVFIYPSNNSLPTSETENQNNKNDQWGRELVLFKQSVKEAIQTINTFQKTEKIDSRLIAVGDIYGPGMSLQFLQQLPMMFSSLNNCKLILAKNETNILSPLFVTDAAEGIVRIIFSQSYSGKTITLKSSQAISLINISLILRRISRKYGLDQLEIANTPISWRANQEEGVVFNFTPLTNLEEGLSQTLDWAIKKLHPPTKFLPHIEPKIVVRPQASQLRSGRIKKNFVLVLGFLLSFYIITAITTPFLPPHITPETIQKLQSQIEQGEEQKAEEFVKNNSWLLKINQQISNLTQPLITQISPQTQQTITNQQNQNSLILTSLLDIIYAAQETKQGIEKTINLQSNAPQPHLQAAKNAISNAYTNLSLTNNTQLPQNLIEELGKYYQLLSLSAEIFGQNNQITYLILLSDNTKLRGSGGVVEAVSLVTFDKGKLFNIETYNTTNLDQRLLGLVTPPNELTQATNQTNWLLKDVAWNPDFPSTARQAEWFIDKELNRQVNGTLNLTRSDLEAMMGELKNTQTTTNQSLVDMFNALGQAIKTSSQDQTNRFFAYITKRLLTGQFQFSVRQKTLEEGLQDLSLNGIVKPLGCQVSLSNSCFADYLSLIENNVSEGQVFIDRKLTQEIDLTHSQPTVKITINLTNNSNQTKDNLTTYKSFLRFYTHPQAKLKLFFINGKPGNQTSLKTSNEFGKKTYGFFIELPHKQSTTITLVYEINKPTTNRGESIYQLTLQKQIGANSYPLETTINLPTSATNITTTPTGIITGQSIKFSTDLPTDQTYTVTYSH